jgi:hypothetical protein
MASPRKMLVVVTGTHDLFYADQVSSLRSLSLLVQPYNRGTTPAIIYGLMRIRELDPNAAVAFFRSDHYFADDEALIAHVNSASETAEPKHRPVVLLGITPNEQPRDGVRLDRAGRASSKSRFCVSREPFLGGTISGARLCINGTRLSLEQLCNELAALIPP